MFGQQSHGINHSQALMNPYSFNRMVQPFPFEQQNNNQPNNNIYNFHSNSPRPDLNNPQVIEEKEHIPNQVSFARNFKGRLYNADPVVQKQKEKKQKSYREELEIQMKEAQEKKKKQKEKIEEEDLKFERQFHKQQQIYAQRDAKDKKQEPSYFMVRSSHKNRKKASPRKEPETEVKQPYKKVDDYVSLPQIKPKITKRAYPITSLDISRFSRNPQEEQQERRREQSYEEERISKILSFQHHMLRKLDDLRGDIRNSGTQLQVNRQLEAVRFKIKSHPISLPGIEKETRFDDFYGLPLRKKPEIRSHEMYKISNSFDLGKAGQPKNKQNPHINKNLSKSRSIAQRSQESQEEDAYDDSFKRNDSNQNPMKPINDKNYGSMNNLNNQDNRPPVEYSQGNEFGNFEQDGSRQLDPSENENLQ